MMKAQFATLAIASIAACSGFGRPDGVTLTARPPVARADKVVPLDSFLVPVGLESMDEADLAACRAWRDAGAPAGSREELQSRFELGYSVLEIAPSGISYGGKQIVADLSVLSSGPDGLRGIAEAVGDRFAHFRDAGNCWDYQSFPLLIAADAHTPADVLVPVLASVDHELGRRGLPVSGTLRPLIWVSDPAADLSKPIGRLVPADAKPVTQPEYVAYEDSGGVCWDVLHVRLLEKGEVSVIAVPYLYGTMVEAKQNIPGVEGSVDAGGVQASLRRVLAPMGPPRGQAGGLELQFIGGNAEIADFLALRDTVDDVVVGGWWRATLDGEGGGSLVPEPAIQKFQTGGSATAKPALLASGTNIGVVQASFTGPSRYQSYDDDCRDKNGIERPNYLDILGDASAQSGDLKAIFDAAGEVGGATQQGQ